MAQEYKAGAGKAFQQSVRLLPPGQIVDVRPKTSESWINTATSQQYGFNKQRQATVVHGTSQHTTSQLKDKQFIYYDATGQNPSNDILTIMHGQNEITTALVQQQHSMSLPSRDIPIFDRDSLQYRTFIKSLRARCGSKSQ